MYQSCLSAFSFIILFSHLTNVSYLAVVCTEIAKQIYPQQLLVSFAYMTTQTAFVSKANI